MQVPEDRTERPPVAQPDADGRSKDTPSNGLDQAGRPMRRRRVARPKAVPAAKRAIALGSGVEGAASAAIWLPESAES